MAFNSQLSFLNKELKKIKGNICYKEKWYHLKVLEIGPYDNVVRKPDSDCWTQRDVESKHFLSWGL